MIMHLMMALMNTFTIVKTQTSMKEILRAIIAVLIQKHKILVGVANMTKRTSNHAICAAGVEVEFHG
jgi:hypothetical protein